MLKLRAHRTRPGAVWVIDKADETSSWSTASESANDWGKTVVPE